MTITPLNSTHTAAQGNSPERIKDAAKQFEALLIGQLLKDAREARGDQEDQTTTSIQEMSEQQLATAMTSGGGLGMAKLIIGGLNARASYQSGENAASVDAPAGSVRKVESESLRPSE